MVSRQTVLVVEDDPDLLRFAQVTLRLAGYRVVTASDGEQALVAARKARPALVLLDLRLPVLDGWQVLDRMAADPELSTIPVLIVTATADGLSQARSEAGSVVGYLVKPLSADALLAGVEKATAKPAGGAPPG
jgi:CheY-like chemotaxis protein